MTNQGPGYWQLTNQRLGFWELTNKRLICLILAGCGETTAKNNTYFISQDADTSPCSLKVCPMSEDICQIRHGPIRGSIEAYCDL